MFKFCPRINPATTGGSNSHFVGPTSGLPVNGACGPAAERDVPPTGRPEVCPTKVKMELLHGGLCGSNARA